MNVIPRDVLGIPVLAIALPLSRLPPRLADALIWPVLKAYYPSYRRVGLRKARRGPFRQISERNRIPLLDIGTIAAIRRGEITVLPEIGRLDGSKVSFTDDSSRTFDAIVLATGFEPNLPWELDHADGREGGIEPGLHYCGFFIAPTGMLREIGIEARRIARTIRASLTRRC